MAKMKSLEDLFINLLNDIHYAEKQTRPSYGFEHHLKETEGQVECLKEVFALCDTKATGKTCQGIKGILQEGEEGSRRRRGARCRYNR